MNVFWKNIYKICSFIIRLIVTHIVYTHTHNALTLGQPLTPKVVNEAYKIQQ